MQLNPSCEATPFAPESGLSRGMASHQGKKCHVASPEGLVSCQGGLSMTVPLYI